MNENQNGGVILILLLYCFCLYEHNFCVSCWPNVNYCSAFLCNVMPVKFPPQRPLAWRDRQRAQGRNEINIQNLNLFNPIFKSIFQRAGMGKEVNLRNYEYQASTKKYINSHKQCSQIYYLIVSNPFPKSKFLSLRNFHIENFPGIRNIDNPDTFDVARN